MRGRIRKTYFVARQNAERVIGPRRDWDLERTKTMSSRSAYDFSPLPNVSHNTDRKFLFGRRNIIHRLLPSVRREASVELNDEIEDWRSIFTHRFPRNLSLLTVTLYVRHDRRVRPVLDSESGTR